MPPRTTRRSMIVYALGVWMAILMPAMANA
jgi:hypothetical protein